MTMTMTMTGIHHRPPKNTRSLPTRGGKFKTGNRIQSRLYFWTGCTKHLCRLWVTELIQCDYARNNVGKTFIYVTCLCCSLCIQLWILLYVCEKWECSHRYTTKRRRRSIHRIPILIVFDRRVAACFFSHAASGNSCRWLDVTLLRL